jgi:hypothetical protein
VRESEKEKKLEGERESVVYPSLHRFPNLSVYHSLHGIYRIHTGFYKQMHLTQLNTLKTHSKIHGYCYN